MQRELCNRVTMLCLCALLALSAGEPPGPIMPLAEVEPGLEAQGWSVFAGGEPEPFDVEVLGVWSNVGPDTSYILARLSGRQLEETGVIAGMSGSPVYVGDRLLGAVAFSWPFATDAIAGITPIEQMRRMAGEPAVPAQPADAAAAPFEALLDPPEARAYLRSELAALHPSAETSSSLLWTSVGLGAGTRALLGEAFASTVAAGGSGVLESDLQPGDAVAAVLIDGDLRLAATGTVTDRLGDSVLAFGHPFLSMGDILVPMAATEILAVVPSLANSFKIGNVGQTLGSFDRDRPSGIRGTMGLEAPTLPMTVRIQSATRREFTMQVARIPPVAGSLVATALLGSIDAAAGMGGQQSLEMKARIGLAGRSPLVLRQAFDGSSASLDAAVYMLTIVGFLVNNSFAELDVTGLEIDLSRGPGPRVTRVVAAHPDRRIVGPGERLQLSVELEPYRGPRASPHARPRPSGRPGPGPLHAPRGRRHEHRRREAGAREGVADRDRPGARFSERTPQPLGAGRSRCRRGRRPGGRRRADAAAPRLDPGAVGRAWRPPDPAGGRDSPGGGGGAGRAAQRPGARGSRSQSKGESMKAGSLSWWLAAWVAGWALAGAAEATEVRSFRQQSRQDFADGVLNGFAIDAEGALIRSRSFERIAAVEEPFVFSAVAGRGAWILGTGNDGRVLRVDAEGTIATLWTAPEPEIFALWADPDGAVFVGSSPNGKVYRLAGDEAEVFFDPGETYIWALARAPWGDLLVATGDEGRLYAVSAAGEGRLVHDGDETHVRSLQALDETVLIGTAGDGLIQSLDRQGRVRTLFDADQSEVLAFARDAAGGWYAAAVASEASFTGTNVKKGDDDDEDKKDEAEVVVEVSESTSGAAPAGARSAILRGGVGDVRSVASLDRETVYSLAWVDEALWIGTGVEGKIFSLHETELSQQTTLEDRQVIAIFAGAEPVFVTTNAAALYRVGEPLGGAATYTSKALDAGSMSRFGTLRWRGEGAPDGAVELAVRSGLSSEPDATWSDWSVAARGSEIALDDVPAGRFVQWRLTASEGAGQSLRVALVELSYRQNNGAPNIRRFAAMDPGQVLVPSTFNPGDQVYEPAHPNREGIFTTLEPALESKNGSRLKTLWRKGFRTLRWEATDPNEDGLDFGLSFREADREGDWMAMAGEIDESYYSFDATALPDGLYRFRLTANDRQDNPGGDALEAARVSEPVVIDHSPPELAHLETGGGGGGSASPTP